MVQKMAFLGLCVFSKQLQVTQLFVSPACPNGSVSVMICQKVQTDAELTKNQINANL